MTLPDFSSSETDGPYAWARLTAALALMTIGGFGMFTCIVALVPVAAEFGLTRAEASLPFTLFTIGFGAGGVAFGWAATRYGIATIVFVGGLICSAGFFLAATAPSFWVYAFAFGVPIGLLGAAATFSPLVADTSLWFEKRRGFAISIVISGNYVAGAIWPPIVQGLIDGVGWRNALALIGCFCLATMPPLALMLRRRPPILAAEAAAGDVVSERPLGMGKNTIQGILCCAGIACCIAMAMPQVHIVAFCADLGLGAFHGANMLSVMMAAGVASRLISGWISDKIGGFRTLVLGSLLQMLTLALFLPFDTLTPLYLVAFLFGLSQGGIVPSYAMIVRGAFPAKDAGWRIGMVMSFTLFGMAIGGWMSGYARDLTGDYDAAIINGIAFNILNLAVATWLLFRARRAFLGTPVATAIA